MVATAMLENFQVVIYPQPVVRCTSCFVLGWVFGDGGSNGAVFDSNKLKMAAAAILDNFEWPYESFSDFRLILSWRDVEK